jgi:signal transduction histidine kinase
MADTAAVHAAPDARARRSRAAVATVGVGLALASAAWIVPADWPTYAVFFAFAFAFSFVWSDSDAPTSVAHMATATAFVYIAGFPILFFELAARLLAYPLIFLAARLQVIALPRPLRPIAGQGGAGAALDLAAMLGLATIGLGVRAGVVVLAQAGGVASFIVIIALAEISAYAVMAALSAWLPMPTRDYLVAAPRRLPAEDERVDVIFGALGIVPGRALLIWYGWLVHGLIGAAAWSLTSLAPHAVMQLLSRRRQMLDQQRVALEHANAALARKHDEMEAFTHAVAHDLKAPMLGITWKVTSVLDAYGEALPQAVRDDVQDVLRRATTTHRMVVDLLRMVEIVSAPEDVGTVDLAAVTADALDVLRPYIDARGIRVDVAVPLPAVPGQAAKLRHVVANLIENAVHFVPRDTGRVRVGARADGGSVVLTVRDNGVGIPAQYHRDIFEMFRRVPNGSGDHARSGMGLAIVKRIVETHGGEVWVESAPGAGSAFSVRLPGLLA